jgi:hypothetical protein
MTDLKKLSPDLSKRRPDVRTLLPDVRTLLPDVRTLLNDGDPLREGEGLAPVDVERMRRVIVSAAQESAPVRTPWLRPFAITAVGALLVVVASMTGDRVVIAPAPAPATPDPLAAVGGGGDGERRQLQFATPGGTRIIWIFDQNLRLQESMP